MSADPHKMGEAAVVESELYYKGQPLVFLCQPPQVLSTFFFETRFLIGLGLLGSLD